MTSPEDPAEQFKADLRDEIRKRLEVEMVRDGLSIHLRGAIKEFAKRGLDEVGFAAAVSRAMPEAWVVRVANDGVIEITEPYPGPVTADVGEPEEGEGE